MSDTRDLRSAEDGIKEQSNNGGIHASVIEEKELLLGSTPSTASGFTRWMFVCNSQRAREPSSPSPPASSLNSIVMPPNGSGASWWGCKWRFHYWRASLQCPLKFKWRKKGKYPEATGPPLHEHPGAECTHGQWEPYTRYSVLHSLNIKTLLCGGIPGHRWRNKVAGQ